MGQMVDDQKEGVGLEAQDSSSVRQFKRNASHADFEWRRR